MTTMTDEIIEISPCPVCGQAHRYPVEVIRSEVLLGRGSASTKIVKTWHRLFTCPTKDELYEANIPLEEDERGSVTAVKVKGIVKEEHDGND